MNIPLACLASGALGVAAAVPRPAHPVLRPLALGLTGLGAALAAEPALADQHLMAADNAEIACTVSATDLTRIALVDDAFASVSKLSTGYPYNDFTVTNEPLRGDIYISVPATYAARSVNFFATSKAGLVYKFICQVGGTGPEQIFITSPSRAATGILGDRDEGQRLSDEAIALIEAMATDALPDGYRVRNIGGTAIRTGGLKVRQTSEYRGPTLSGKTLRIENRSADAIEIADSDLSLPGTLAVSIADRELEPGMATTAWLVLRTGS